MTAQRVRVVSAVVGVMITLCPLVLLGDPTPAGAASGSSALQGVACTPLSSDPQVTTPEYALNEGAGSVPGGWWCLLPHATKLPARFVERRRFFIPLQETDYGSYWTWYGVRQPGKPTSTLTPSTAQPGIVVKVYANAQVIPPHKIDHESYRARGKTSKVRLSSGVTATVFTKGKSVWVLWRFSTRGVPRYLRTVGTVWVTGTDLPRSTVIAVAGMVRPA